MKFTSWKARNKFRLIMNKRRDLAMKLKKIGNHRDGIYVWRIYMKTLKHYYLYE